MRNHALVLNSGGLAHRHWSFPLVAAASLRSDLCSRFSGDAQYDLFSYETGKGSPFRSEETEMPKHFGFVAMLGCGPCAAFRVQHTGLFQLHGFLRKASAQWNFLDWLSIEIMADSQQNPLALDRPARLRCTAHAARPGYG
jgi:hypothetical protein